MKSLLTIRALRSPLGNFVIGILLAVVLGVLLHTSLSLTALAAIDATAPDALVNIAGKVTDENGQPLAGIEVTVYRRELYDSYYRAVRLAITSATGEYKAIGLGAGIYRLLFNGASGGYEIIYYGGAAIIEGAQDVLVTGSPVTIDFTLSPAATLTGFVSLLGEQNADNGYVYAMQKINDSWRQVNYTTISTTGEYSLTSLPAGVYRLWAFTNIPPYYSGDYLNGYYGGVELESAQDVTVTAGEVKTNLDIVAGFGQNDGTISGQVTSEGTPLAGIKVAIYNSYNAPSDYLIGYPLVYTFTESAGHFSIGGLANGIYVVEFSDPAEVYATVFYNQKRFGNQSTAVTIENSNIISEINASLAQAGTISGTLRFASGAPANNVVLQYYWQNDKTWEHGPDYQVFSDQSGNYLIKNLWPGVYKLSFFHWFYGGEIYGAPNYYDYSSPDYYNFDLATTITIEAGSQVTNINQIIGPDFVAYLPAIAQ